MGEVTTVAASLANTLNPEAMAELKRAMATLSSSGNVVVRMASSLSRLAGSALAQTIRTVVAAPRVAPAWHTIADFALRRAFTIAILRLHLPGQPEQTRRFAKPLVTLSGAVGGFAGIAGFIPDATVTSLAIMREIARIAQDEGEDLASDDTRLACLQVFAVSQIADPAAKAAPNYFSSRLMLQGQPLAILFGEVASRYGLSLSQKFAAGAVPIFGAVGGAAINNAFLAHYRSVAKAHFTVRRLERIYGAAQVQAAATAW